MDEERMTNDGQGGESISAGSFPSPDDVHVIVRKNNNELRILMGSSFWSEEEGTGVPRPLWNWFRESRLPAAYFLRFGHVFQIAAGLSFILGTFLSISSAGQGTSGWISIANLGFGIAFFVVPSISGRRVRIHFAKYLAEHAGLVCPDCGYLLHGLPPKHVCPECGRKYSIVSVRQYWLRWMATRSLRYPSSSDLTRGK
ncbi:MAG: hypothetical protein HS101_03720 [Planctomycetia bacterium]|nr:hypothetical protein [Planctomycetia bacterium]MCC7316027.1 hypothetical protein [Planctomycetota bacterium]